MAKQPVTIDFDPDLLEALRAEEPGKPDRDLLEDLAHRKLGMSAVRRLRGRSNLPEDEAIALGASEPFMTPGARRDATRRRRRARGARDRACNPPPLTVRAACELLGI